MSPRQQENLKGDFQTLGNAALGSGHCFLRLSLNQSCTNRNMVPVINRGLRKSGGKGKKYDKETMRASLDSR